jgi:hypothetical protein
MPSSRQIARILQVVLFIVVCVISAHAQITTGTVRGTVTDPNGAVVQVPKSPLPRNQRTLRALR